jgi:hypothetical protein
VIVRVVNLNVCLFVCLFVCFRIRIQSCLVIYFGGLCASKIAYQSHCVSTVNAIGVESNSPGELIEIRYVNSWFYTRNMTGYCQLYYEVMWINWEYLESVKDKMMQTKKEEYCINLWNTMTVWRYQRGNQNPYIEEEQTTQWPKEKVQKSQDLVDRYGISVSQMTMDMFHLS